MAPRRGRAALAAGLACAGVGAGPGGPAAGGQPGSAASAEPGRPKAAAAEWEGCPLGAVRANLEALLQEAEAPGAEPAAAAYAPQMRVLLGRGEGGLGALCCGGGWSGDGAGAGGGPADGGLCWSGRGPGDFRAFARCCYAGLRRLTRAPAPDWMVQEIDSDLQPWRGQRITRASLDQMERDWGHVFCRFRVRAGRLVTCDPAGIDVLGKDKGGEPLGQYQALARVTRALAANELLPDGLDFFVSPQIFDHVELPVPVFTKARAVFAQGLIRVPSFELLGPWIDRMRGELSQVEWSDKEPKLYWRGGMRSFNSCPCPAEALTWPLRWQRFNMSRFLAQSHVLPGGCYDLPPSACAEASSSKGRCRCHRHITNRTTFEWSNRVRLCELSRRHPDLVDAKLSYIPETTYASILRACQERGYLSTFSRPGDHSRYRYLMSTDGSTIDDTRVYWMLSSGSVVFKQVTPLLPYGVPGLEPWAHFVPVREDLGDLLAKLRWARRHDAACQEMARRARAFAEAFFTEEQIMHYVYRALTSYAQLLEPAA